LRVLAYYVEWHLRQAWAPLPLDDEDKPSAEALRPSGVATATRSPSATAKARRKRASEGLPVHSFRTLPTEMGTRSRNHCRLQSDLEAPAFLQLAEPTALQQRALELLGLLPVHATTKS
jgi:hypothetical protein